MIKIFPSQLNGTIKAPASASHAQRLLFMAALSDVATTIYNVPSCKETDAAVDCIRSVGCTVTNEGSTYTVVPYPKNVPVLKADFDFKDSFRTALFAIAVSGALGFKVSCTGSAALQKRRLNALTSRMALRGVTFTNFSIPCSLEGRLVGGDYVMDADEATEEICALFLALPLLHDESIIKLNRTPLDSPSLELTIDSLKHFGIVIEKMKNGCYRVPGKQRYKSPGEVSVENDWILSSMWVTAAAAEGRDDLEVTVTGLSADSPRRIDKLAGIKTMLHYDFSSVNIDMGDCPDLAVLVASLAMIKGAEVELTNIPSLRYTNKGRLKFLAEITKILGQIIKISEDEGCICIQKKSASDRTEGAELDCKGDPILFISIVLASTTMKFPVTLTDETCADMIYSDFLKDFKELGGKYEIIEPGEPEEDPEESSLKPARS